VDDQNGDFTSIDLGADGVPAIAYRRMPAQDLMYARRDVLVDGSWILSGVDTPGMVGQYASMQLDAAGAAHIVYTDHSSLSLKYAAQVAGIWVVETVTSQYGVWASLALDSAGRPHVAYTRYPAGPIYFASRRGASWSSEIVEGGTNIRPTLAIDGTGSPHLTYSHHTEIEDNELRYARRMPWSQKWQKAVVIPSGLFSYSPVAVDDTGNRPQIAIGFFQDLYWVRKDASWQSFCHLSNDMGLPTSLSRRLSLQLDSTGAPHIAYIYRHGSSFTLAYAHEVEPSIWAIQGVLDSYQGQESDQVSLALDSNGRAHIAYNAGQDGVRYATNADP
jgi:hypothetical protein